MDEEAIAELLDRGQPIGVQPNGVPSTARRTS